MESIILPLSLIGSQVTINHCPSPLFLAVQPLTRVMRSIRMLIHLVPFGVPLSCRPRWIPPPQASDCSDHKLAGFWIWSCKRPLWRTKLQFIEFRKHGPLERTQNSCCSRTVINWGAVLWRCPITDLYICETLYVTEGAGIFYSEQSQNRKTNLAKCWIRNAKLCLEVP